MRTLAVLLLAVVLLSGCATGPKRVSAAEFKSQYDRGKMAHSAQSFTYLGERDGQGYLKIGRVSLWGNEFTYRTIYVELSKLDAEFRDALPKKEMKEPL